MTKDLERERAQSYANYYRRKIALLTKEGKSVSISVESNKDYLDALVKEGDYADGYEWVYPEVNEIKPERCDRYDDSDRRKRQPIICNGIAYRSKKVAIERLKISANRLNNLLKDPKVRGFAYLQTAEAIGLGLNWWSDFKPLSGEWVKDSLLSDGVKI